jgi:AcrR family transcriptional regulator
VWSVEVRSLRLEGRVADREKAPRRDEEVLQAAIAEFYERGYSAATIRDVADRLGINKGSLYHYVESKEALLLRIVRRVHEDSERVITTILVPDEINSLERVAYYVRCQVAYNLAHPRLLSVYHREMSQLTGQGLDDARDRRREHDRLLVGLIREAQQDGDVPGDRDARMLADFVFMNLVATHRWFQKPRQGPLADATDRYTEYVMRGVSGVTPYDCTSSIRALPLAEVSSAEAHPVGG